MRILLGLLPVLALGQMSEINPSRMRAEIAFLSSEPMEGRLSLQRGSDVTAQWIASEYAKMGLVPLVGNSYLQPVPIVEFRNDRERTRLAFRGRSFTLGRGFVGSFPDDVRVKAEVVFAGFGIHAPKLGYDDYAGLDVRGKIVLVLNHEPQETDPKSIFNGVGNTVHANTRIKVLEAQKRGAVAVLLAEEPNRRHPSNEDRRKRISTGPARIQQLPLQVLEDNATKIPLFTLDDATAKELLPQLSELQAKIDGSLKPASMATGVEAEVQVVVAERKRGVIHNVVGMVPGTDPVLQNETLIVSGHYDHDGVLDGKMYPGADDNASGAVGTMELARAFLKSPVRPRRSILFICFAAEERGLLGAYHYADHPLRPLKTTRAVTNFDMISRDEKPSAQTEGLIEVAPDTSNEVGVIGSVYSPQLRDTIEAMNSKIGLRITDKWDRDHALNVYQRSDQFPFAVKGIPALWWFTGFHPDYHQPTDTVEKLNFPKMVRILQLAYLTVEKLANQDGYPAFVENPKGR